MLKKIKNFLRSKISGYIVNSNPFSKKLDELKYIVAKSHFNQISSNYKNIKNFNQVYYKVFSQNGEDGIIEYLLNILGISNLKFVELGIGTYKEANTRYQFIDKVANGLIIDKQDNLIDQVSDNIEMWKGNLIVENTLITDENINNIIENANFSNDVDLFSLDLDGIDYWILKKLPDNFSKIAIIEYNSVFGGDAEVTVNYDKNFNRFNFHYSSLCYGASLKAVIKLMENKGFDFLGVNDIKNNAFFVMKKYSKLFDLNNDLSLFNCTNTNIRESRNKDGTLSYLSLNDARLAINDCDVFDLKDNTSKKFADI